MARIMIETSEYLANVINMLPHGSRSRFVTMLLSECVENGALLDCVKRYDRDSYDKVKEALNGLVVKVADAQKKEKAVKVKKTENKKEQISEKPTKATAQALVEEIENESDDGYANF